MPTTPQDNTHTSPPDDTYSRLSTSSHHLPTIQPVKEILAEASRHASNGIESGLRERYGSDDIDSSNMENARPVRNGATRSLSRQRNVEVSKVSVPRVRLVTENSISRLSNSSSDSSDSLSKKYQEMKAKLLLAQRQYRLMKEVKDKEIDKLRETLGERDKEIEELKSQLAAERAKRITTTSTSSNYIRRRVTPSVHSSTPSSGSGSDSASTNDTTTTTSTTRLRRTLPSSRSTTSSSNGTTVRTTRVPLSSATTSRLERLRAESDDLQRALHASRAQYQQTTELLAAARVANALASAERNETHNFDTDGLVDARLSRLLGAFSESSDVPGFVSGADHLLSMQIPEEATYEQLLELDNSIVKVGLDPMLKYQFPRRAATEKDTERSCRICMEEYAMCERLVTLPCLCNFHDSCCMKWLEREKRCPVCQIDLDDRSLYSEQS